MSINEFLINGRHKELFCWVKTKTTETEWADFLNKYHSYFKDYTGWIRIPRKRFDIIDSLIQFIYVADCEGKIVKSIHKPFIFCLYLLLNTTTQRDGYCLSIGEIKTLLGFNKETNSIDYLIKENSLLDKYQVTLTRTKGVSGSNNELK